MLEMLRRESIATLGVIGNLLTILAKLKIAPDFLRPFLDQWRDWTSAFWSALLSPFGQYVHPSTSAALSLAFFLIMIGVGARVAGDSKVEWNGRVFGIPLLFSDRWIFVMIFHFWFVIVTWFVLAAFSADAPYSPHESRYSDYLDLGIICFGAFAAFAIGLIGFAARMARVYVLLTLVLVGRLFFP